VLLWQSYTNLGVDEKNQIDLLRVLPGGVVGLKAVVSEFHSLGVTVLFPWNHWGNTTGAIHQKKRKRRKGHALSHHSSPTLTPTLFLELCKKPSTIASLLTTISNSIGVHMCISLNKRSY